MIINPVTGKSQQINSKIGRQILKNYINNYLNGGSSMEVDDSGPDGLEDYCDEPYEEFEENKVYMFMVMRYHGSLGKKLSNDEKHIINKNLTIIESTKPGTISYGRDDGLGLTWLETDFLKFPKNSNLKDIETVGKHHFCDTELSKLLYSDETTKNTKLEEMSNGLRREYGFDYDFAFWKPKYDWILDNIQRRKDIFNKGEVLDADVYTYDHKGNFLKSESFNDFLKNIRRDTFSILELANAIRDNELPWEWNGEIKRIAKIDIINFSCQSLTPTPHFKKYKDLTPDQQTQINELVDESFNNIREYTPLIPSDKTFIPFTLEGEQDLCYITYGPHDGDILGVVGIDFNNEESFFFLHTLCASAEHKGSGICGTLIRAVINNYNNYFIKLHVRVGTISNSGLEYGLEGNISACNCYEKEGFKIVNECGPEIDGENCKMIRPRGAIYTNKLFTETSFCSDHLRLTDNKFVRYPERGVDYVILRRYEDHYALAYKYEDDNWYLGYYPIYDLIGSEKSVDKIIDEFEGLNIE